MGHLGRGLRFRAIVLAAGLVAGCVSGPADGLPADASTTTSSTQSTLSGADDGWCRFGDVPFSGRVADRGDETGWEIGDPADHEIDSASLERGLDEIERLPGIRSFLVARQGVLVVERYFHGAGATQSREIASVSKSILSALVGIAIDRGLITGVDSTLDQLLPAAFAGEMHSDKTTISLRSLLTMTSGFAYEPEIVRRASRPDVSVDQILAAPRLTSRSQFAYNTGGVHLAAAAIHRAAPSGLCDFARRELFEPAGITVDWWNRDADGVPTGGWNMYLTPRELTRFGQVYLDGGTRDSRQIVPAGWVAESLTPRVFQVAGPVTDYGYWWWLSELSGHFVASARGGGEQMIYVIPDLEMVVVTTSETDLPRDAERFDSLTFLWRYVIPAVGG